MTPDQLKSAIERRGYSVRVETGEGWVTFHIRRGDAATNPTYSTHDLAMSKLPLTGFVNAMLYRLSGTMHPLWCKSCHEPLLQDQGTSWLKHAGSWVDGSSMIDVSTSHNYRSAKAGPDSAVIQSCVKCGALLDGNTEGIIDEQ